MYKNVIKLVSILFVSLFLVTACGDSGTGTGTQTATTGSVTKAEVDKVIALLETTHLKPLFEATEPAAINTVVDAIKGKNEAAKKELIKEIAALKTALNNLKDKAADKVDK